MRILLLSLLAICGSTWASLYEVTDLNYQGDEAQAKRAAVTTVLSRLTGRNALPPSVAGLADQPEEWIQSWSLVDELAGVAEFRVDASIRQAVQRMGLPVWTQPRATPWLWLAVDEGTGRQPLTATSDLEIARALMIESERLALPLQLPAWDADDRSQVALAELWGFFFDGVAQANGRYGEDYVAGRLARTGAGWQLALVGSDGARLSETFADAADAARAIHGFWLPSLVARYGVAGSGDLSLSVAGLTADNYDAFIAELRSLDAVERAFPVFSDPQFVRFRVVTGARPEQLAQWLGLPENRFDESAADLKVVARP